MGLYLVELCHPHMQIVGIKNLEFKNMCDKRQFEGIKIAEKIM